MVITAQTEATIRGDGNLELSDEERDALGVGPGDGVLKGTTDQGILVMTPRQYIDWVFDRVGEGLPDDVTLDELIESGRELREELLYEHYGIRPEAVER